MQRTPFIHKSMHNLIKPDIRANPFSTVGIAQDQNTESDKNIRLQLSKVDSQILIGSRDITTRRASATAGNSISQDMR
jgi:hypothetical protein